MINISSKPFFTPYSLFLFTEVPHTSPQIQGIRSRYKIGDIVRGNCTAKYSRPAANLTWTINDVPVSTLL